jgi:N-acetyl sugar amidotransferase
VITYCRSCVMPSTKPDLRIEDDGICSACHNFVRREDVDWAARQDEFLSVVDRYRSRDGSNWDCVIPVSGGKDSTSQVLKVLGLGLNPLCVTATTCDLSEIGRRNIQNIKNLGVDYVEMTPNPRVRHKLNRIGLEEVGDISWPEHASIFTIPVRAAVEYRVPLIVWGENPQNEYGGPATAAETDVLDRRWLEEFGGLLGLRVSDMAGRHGLQQRDLILYTYPTDTELKEVGVSGVFLGYFFPWDGFKNVLLAQGHGFETYHTTVEGSIVNYENLDNHQTGIHDYFKFLKFGFGRASDIACLHLRRGRLSREEALDLVRLHDGKFPWTYLGKPLEDILAPLDIGVPEFQRICDRFTNKRLFKVDDDGALVRDRFANLVKTNDDNVD